MDIKLQNQKVKISILLYQKNIQLTKLVSKLIKLQRKLNVLKNYHPYFYDKYLYIYYNIKNSRKSNVKSLKSFNKKLKQKNLINIIKTRLFFKTFLKHDFLLSTFDFRLKNPLLADFLLFIYFSKITSNPTILSTFSNLLNTSSETVLISSNKVFSKFSVLYNLLSIT